MNSTTLGAEKKENIIFISDAHEKFYYEKLKEVRYQDVYHKALCYCLGISDDTRRNIKSIYDFKTGCVKTECLQEGWQTSGSVKVVRMAFNLYCNGTVGVLPLSSICWTSVNISVIPSISRPESTLRTRKAIMSRRTNGRFSRIPTKPLSAKRLSTLHRKSEARSDDTPMDGAKLLPSQACSTVPIAAARCMSTALTTASVSLNTLAHSTQKSLVERSARHSTVSMKMWYFPLSPICSEP